MHSPTRPEYRSLPDIQSLEYASDTFLRPHPPQSRRHASRCTTNSAIFQSDLTPLSHFSPEPSAAYRIPGQEVRRFPVPFLPLARPLESGLVTEKHLTERHASYGSSRSRK